MGKFKNRRDKGPGMHTLHQAVCDECGKNCEVPFKPSGDKPVYCNECFGRMGGGNSDRDRGGRGDRRDDRRDRGGRDFGRRDSRRPEMFKAVCADCGNSCEIPFKPRTDKPVFCSNCFESKGGGNKRDGGRGQREFNSATGGNNNQFKEQLASINSKIDRILYSLNLNSKVEYEKERETENITNLETINSMANTKKKTKKAAPKKKAVKKVTAKKTRAKAKKKK